MATRKDGLRPDKHSTTIFLRRSFNVFRDSLYFLILVEVAGLIISFALLWFSWCRLTRIPSDHELVVWSNAYSPLLDRRTMHMHEVRLKSAVVNKHNEPPSIYRLQPSPDVDAAWLYLTHHGRNFLITADEVRGLGKDPNGVTHLPDELANGDEKYFAWLQGSHDIHCLDNVRRFMYRDYYYGDQMDDNPIIEPHFLHCMHGLLQTLQCKSSTDVYLAAWVEGQENAIIDVDVTRKCLDYENSYLGWETRSQRMHDDFVKTKPPVGAALVSLDTV